MYAAEDLIAEAEAIIINFKELQDVYAVRYLEFLWESLFRCGRVYENARLNGVFVEELHESITILMQNYWGAHKNATLQRLLQSAKTLIKPQEGSNSTSTPSRNNHYVQHEQNLSKRKSKNTPSITMKERQGSNSSLSSSKNPLFRSTVV